MAYDFWSYFDMIGDVKRTDAYVRALQAAIRPGDSVVEIGTGNGYFAIIAAKLGAAEVVAIEPNDMIDVAREFACANGVGDSIRFIEAMSTAVELPKKADVMVSDLRGILPFFQAHIPSITDARERLLATGGRQIPERDEIYAACVSSERIFSHYGLATEIGAEVTVLDPLYRRLRSIWTKQRVKPEECITQPFHIATLDYRTLTDSRLRAEVSWRVPEDRTAHGMCVWFDAKLFGDVGYSNAPTHEKGLIYGQAFFPFLEPIELRADETVTVTFDGALVRGSYVWQWNTTVRSADDTARIALRQNTLEGIVTGSEKRRRRAGDHRPEVNRTIELTRFVLERVDGERSLEAMAREVSEAFPDTFESWSDALTFVGEAIEKNR